MKDIAEIQDTIFVPIIRNLMSREPIIYGDHPNLWIDIGYHASQGSGAIGEIIDHDIEQLILGYLHQLPEFVQERIWWESDSGREYDIQVLETFEVNGTASGCYPPGLEDIQLDVCRLLKHQLYIKAEAAYAEYESMND